MTNDEQREWYATGCARIGYGVDPLPFFSDKRSGRDESPMTLSTQRAEADPRIAVHRWDVRHNVLADGPLREPVPAPAP